MTMSEKERGRLVTLIIKRIKGRTDAAEDGRLEAWAALSTDNRRMLNELLDTDTLIRQLLQYEKPDLSDAWQKLTLKIPALASVPRPGAAASPIINGKVHRSRSWWGIAAAAAVAVVAGGVYLYIHRDTPAVAPPRDVARETSNHQEKAGPTAYFFQPASYKLTVAVRDVTTLDAASVPKKGMSLYGDLFIRRQGQDTLVYEHLLAGQAPGRPTVNTVSTPKGGWYNVVLPDGSKVRLNAASSLDFMTTFGPRERTVTLQGEAYFEVTHAQPAPFIVKVKRAGDTVKISAEGTTFNVKAYKDDGYIKTSLVDGRLQVADPRQRVVARIHPGEEYLQYENGINRRLMPDDIQAAIAWKNGRFNFSEAPLQDVMRQIGRWYDADIVFRDNPEMKVNMEVSSKDPLAEVLKSIQTIGPVHFAIEGKKIIVSR